MMNNTITPSNPETEKTLHTLGWSPFFQNELEQLKDVDGAPYRVTGSHKQLLNISNGTKESLISVPQGFHYHNYQNFPVVGDWVLVKEETLTGLLPRKSYLLRGASGTHGKQNQGSTKGQPIAANVDIVFIVCGLDRDFNLRRIERYLTWVYNCGITPVIVLTKGDLHSEPTDFVSQTEQISFGVDILTTSLSDDAHLEILRSFFKGNKTGALVGSSGAGKSTLINRLLGRSVQATGMISESVGKGKHTTTSRDLLLLPFGGQVIDNPGMRELSFSLGSGSMEQSFPDIEQLALECRYPDCTHSHEPGCRVREEILQENLSADRLLSYQKLKKELHYYTEKEHKSSARIEKEQWKWVSQKAKAIKKNRRY